MTSKRKLYEIGDVVIVIGSFWENFGVIGKVTEINGNIVTAQDDMGNQFSGAIDDFFTVDEVKELIATKEIVNFDHPWLTDSSNIEPSCCDEFKDVDFNFCPRCGNEL